MNINISNTSYSNEIASPEVEIAGEASGSVFADMKSRHADLKAMLDSNKESLKLEAMRRIITMVAKGKDASDLFPAVVKNVAAKSLELKKLVYAYLTRYAEEQQDLALLSISTFQRALKDPNQLIRASALRVLSSIRVPMIVPIMMLAIKESMRDMSPYVRKTAAHAIPKLYYLDNDQKEELITVIDHLMADRTTLVVGSAVYAFEEVCPDRFDLVHKHYRKLCQLVVDVDEWGQVIMLSLLTRYARTQFADPNSGDEDLAAEDDGSNFYSSDDEDSSSEDSADGKEVAPKPSTRPTKLEMDPDLRNLLRCTKSLLQSRNASVVLAVAQLYYHLAPKTEVGLISRALIRLLRNHREVQSIVLTNIATISAKRRNMFEAFLKSFFVRSEDPTHIKLLKLEILTNLATQSNISIILREFQTYVATQDKEFAAATIDAIGRCASNIKEVTDVCLSGLVNLMSNRNETVVAQSVVVIKKLLQMQPSQHQDIIVAMARIMDKIQVSAARASIVWLIGEYCERVPKIAPDVLRKMAKSFTSEEEIVKLQILNLAIKLLLTNPDQTHLLVHYVFTLARYDQSYDLRDRARFLKNLVMPAKTHNLQQFSRSVFLTPKPAPVIEGRFKSRGSYQLGTLSHYLNQRCVGYHDLPEFPVEPPDPSVRNSEQFPTASSMEVKPVLMSAGVSQQTIASGTASSLKKFYSEGEDGEGSSASGGDENTSSESGSEESDGSESGEEESSSAESDSETESGSSESEKESDESEKPKKETLVVKPAPAKPQLKPEKQPPASLPRPTKLEKEKEKKSKKSPRPDKPTADATDLLLDFDFDGPSQPAVPIGAGAAFVTPKSGGAAALVPTTAPVGGTGGSPGTPALKLVDDSLQTTAPQYMPTTSVELVNKLTGQGLSVSYRFTRSPNLFSGRSVSVELQFRNLSSSNQAIDGIKIGEKKLPPGMDMAGFPEVATLPPGASHCCVIGIDYGDTSQPALFTIHAGDSRFPITLTAPLGEQLQPVRMGPDRFKTEQTRLSGMNETSGTFKLADGLSVTDPKTLMMKVYQVANVTAVEGAPENKVLFVGQSMSSKVPVLVSVEKKSGNSEVRMNVNCEKMVIGSMLFKELKKAIC